MGTLSRWEEALERWQEALLAKVFHTEPVELLEALRHECDDHAVVCSQERVVVPNAYEIQLDRTVHQELVRRGGRVGQALTDALARHGERQGYEWAGPLTVRVTTSAGLPNGRYRIISTAMPHVRAAAFPRAA
ncbi:DUF3662 domain-containing protein [Streptomyces sp. LP05-1]|uniref:DUF3662 domain-containing protein n=1 Tax=Streptomyces pyxinae TaxID=2970734 RepID=A0ABT2CJF1_9ACTN|nr:DUF3662 domain-containing protein [Streptomyces sp. LP05-1]MCS0636841.1 DUF3662 domain-containing protein [Streptomyces sp. LP05-1]